MLQLRSLLRRALLAPVSSALVILLVAVVVACNTSIFASLWALGGKALPYRADHELVEMRIDLLDIDFQVSLAPRLLEALQQSKGFAAAIGFPESGPRQLDSEGRGWVVQRISPDFTEVLGVPPQLGGPLASTTESLDVGVVPVLISHDWWQRRFAGDPQVIGQRVKLPQQDLEVVGVMPAGFGFPDARTEVWSAYAPTQGEREQDAAGGFGNFTVVARLLPGTSLTGARQLLEQVLRADPSLAKMDPDRTRARADVRQWRERFSALHWRTLVILQMAAVLLLLLVAASLANLGLDQALARQRELATRLALGSSLAGLRQSVLAGLLPAVLLGALLGLAAVPSVLALMRSRELLPLGWPLSPQLDSASLAVAVMIALLLLGAAISLGWRRAVLIRGRANASHVVGGTLGPARRSMLVAQIALSLALLGCTGLLLRSASQLLARDRGFDPQGLLLTAVALDKVENAPAGTAVWAALAPLVRGLPGVEKVAIADMPPFSGAEFIGEVRLPGQAESLEVAAASVSPDYFSVLGAKLHAGREFQPADVAGKPVLIDMVFKQRWFGTVDPVGASLEILDGEGQARTARIIGVVPEIRQQALDEATRRPTVYQLMIDPGPSFFLLTRTRTDAAALVRPLEQVLRQLVPGLESGFSQPLQERINLSLRARQSLLEAVGVFAVLSLVVAALALYAVLSVAVRRRRTELGLRLALGARHSALSQLVLAEGGRLVVWSLLPGLLLGLLLAQQLQGQLFQLGAADPLTWASSACLLVFTTLLACWIPALKATRIAPAQVLKPD